MDDLGRRIGGTAVHIGDAYIWAQINYLDSPTDYREYLPTTTARPWANDDLVLLDDINCTPWFAPGACAICASVLCTCIIVLVRGL